MKLSWFEKVVACPMLLLQKKLQLLKYALKD